MLDHYMYINEVTHLYALLQDEISQELFGLRLRYDVAPSMETAFQLIEAASGDNAAGRRNWKTTFEDLLSKQKKIILYGTGAQGRVIAKLIWRDKKDFWGFCCRNAERYPDGILGKPVYSPDYLLSNMDDYYVLISTSDYYEEIYTYLRSKKFPEQHILSFSASADKIQQIQSRQYFDFLQFYKPGTAFVDAGCFDCRDSLRFVQWCANKYSKIYAFEPETANYKHCRNIAAAKGLQRFELIHAGLGRTCVSGSLSTQGHSSKIISQQEAPLTDNMETISIVTLDDIIQEKEVGFIKMDIEGAEYDALLGAEKVIIRNTPLLAICIYHRQGDMLAIMEYLHSIVPEYRFWIRHYSICQNETVLYAAVP